MATQTILFDGKPYVILPRDEFDRLTTLAKAADLPPLPEPNAEGNYPAVDYARASLARKIIRDRVAVGLNQRQLALRAGVRVETLCRIETGKHTPSVPTIDKLDRVLKAAAKQQQTDKGHKRRARKGR
jgi:ribosome-binding protein aMBF1 (putative translation factor)